MRPRTSVWEQHRARNGPRGLAGADAQSQRPFFWYLILTLPREARFAVRRCRTSVCRPTPSLRGRKVRRSLSLRGCGAWSHLRPRCDGSVPSIFDEFWKGGGLNGSTRGAAASSLASRRPSDTLPMRTGATPQALQGSCRCRVRVRFRCRPSVGGRSSSEIRDNNRGPWTASPGRWEGV